MGVSPTCPQSRYCAAGQDASPPPHLHLLFSFKQLQRSFHFALIKGLAPSGCFFLYTEPATRGRFFFSGIACKS